MASNDTASKPANSGDTPKPKPKASGSSSSSKAEDEAARDAVVIPRFERELSEARDYADHDEIERIQKEYQKARSAKLKRQSGGDN
jgi:hypothetical protein